MAFNNYAPYDHLNLNYSYDDDQPITPVAQQHPHYYSPPSFAADDASPPPSWPSRFLQQHQHNIAQPVPHSPDSSLAHALDDLHVSYAQQEAAGFYDYNGVLRDQSGRLGYESCSTTAAAYTAADQMPCMDTAQVPCAESGESYCSDDDSPYTATHGVGAVLAAASCASPVLPFHAASPFTDLDVVDSPTAADFADAYADNNNNSNSNNSNNNNNNVHSPIHYSSHSFDRPVVPSRSYTLERAVTLAVPTLADPPSRSPSLADTKRSASTSDSSDTTGSSPPSSVSPAPSSKPSTPLSTPISSATPSSTNGGKPRGRPRKRQNTDAKTNSPPRIVDYPFPKFDGTSGGATAESGKNSNGATGTVTTSDTKRSKNGDDGGASVQQAPPPVMSMDEIPIPDAESKPGQAIFKLNTPPEVKEKPKKKPILACLFCRERKIACGQPLPGSTKCNQCARRGLDCEFPKESRRGQHKRGPRAARVAALAEAAFSNTKRPLEPAPASFSSGSGTQDADPKHVKVENAEGQL